MVAETELKNQLLKDPNLQMDTLVMQKLNELDKK